jgi:DNA topoisomerase-1
MVMQFKDASGYAVKTEIKQLVPTQGANKWWSRPAQAKDIKWTTFDHNGLVFSPPYEPHGVKMLYDGVPVELTPDQEEIATYYAQALGSDHVTKAKFRENFFADWKKILGSDHVIKLMDKCDFRPIREHLDAQKELKVIERKTVEFKERTKREKEESDSIYGFAIVNGFREQVGNYRTEIPSLFRGRGGHPKTGKIKRRVMPEDVILNIGPNTPIPPCPIPGHQWKGVIHNNQVTWMAFWRDEVTNSFKYVQLAASSRFKGESDRNKYNKARRLHNRIDQIRASYTADLDSNNSVIAQRATAMYLIDKLALRVGNEKDTSESADTVGCCSLRVEHIKFNEGNVIELDFLGKDSIQYHNEVVIDEKPYKNLQRFCAKKAGSQDIFDKLNPSKLNDHLKELMPDLSAKVFRTYNASITLETQLALTKITPESTPVQKYAAYTDANRLVAILCNHQKAVSKGHGDQMAGMENKLQEMEDLMEALKNKKIEQHGGKKLPADRKDAITKLNKRIVDHKGKMALKEDNKTVSLGTSKINYMDPRISIAWCKKIELPIEKVFNKALLTKFPWAMEVPATWKFEDINVSDF